MLAGLSGFAHPEAAFVACGPLCGPLDDGGTGRCGLRGAWLRPYWAVPTDRSRRTPPRWKETTPMVTIGIDAHKRSHTAVLVDEHGRELAQRTIGSRSSDHLELIAWARRQARERLWAVEDCRHLSRRLERDLIRSGERIVRVPPKLMAKKRTSARSYGKSDPIAA